MSNLNPVTSIFNVVDCLIDQSVDDDLSEAVPLGGRVLTGLVMPAAWTAANITFQASVDGTTYYALEDVTTGTPVAVGITSPAASKHYALNPNLWFSVRFLKIATSAGQAADRTIQLILGDPTSK